MNGQWVLKYIWTTNERLFIRFSGMSPQRVKAKFVRCGLQVRNSAGAPSTKLLGVRLLKPIADESGRRSMGQTAHERRDAADRGEHRQAAAGRGFEPTFFTLEQC